ncbi:MAG: hypothetical protein HPY83_17125 [Anaerolineae bacterium]|nr:hypothetical protein [Anaerolineae bacterium]
MSEQTEPTRCDAEDQRWENVRSLYCAAVSMWATAGSDSVGRLNGFALTNAALIAGILALLSSPNLAGQGKPPLSTVSLILAFVAALAGIAFTLVAGGAMLRSVAYARVYMAVARRSEALLAEQVPQQAVDRGTQLVGARDPEDHLNRNVDGLGPILAGMQAQRRGFRGWHGSPDIVVLPCIAYEARYEYVVLCLMVMFVVLYLVILPHVILLYLTSLVVT